jgi:hypothetical protein
MNYVTRVDYIYGLDKWITWLVYIKNTDWVSELRNSCRLQIRIG